MVARLASDYNAAMKRQRSTSRGRMPRNSERLVALAVHLKASGSRLEDGFWERELDLLLTKLLAAGNDEAVEAALKLHGGRVLINSINFEAGEEKAEKLVALARQFGAGLVALTIDERGMAMDAGRKVEIAKRLTDFCVQRGMRPGDLLVDVLTFTIGSGDPSLKTAAVETMEAIRRIKRAIPGERTL